jgi:hypothetical protein
MFASDVRCYLKERVLRWRIGLVWLLVFVGVLVTTDEPVSRIPGLVLITALFILVFRLWDDLADLQHDREHHPDRCLCRVQNLRPFRISLWLSVTVLLGLLLMLADGKRALALLAVMATFALLYGLTTGRPDLRRLRIPLVLAKYPAFVLLLADDPGDDIALLVALGVYIPPLVDEVRSTGPEILRPAATLIGLAALGWLSLKI